MNSRIINSIGVVLLCTLFIAPLLAQTQLSTDKRETIYRVGETVKFQARSSTSGTYNYKIYYDTRTKAIESGTISLSANQTKSISYRANKAGVVLCSITGPGGSDIAAATFSPFDIKPLENEPSDFDRYWNTQKSLVSGLGTNPQTSVLRNNAHSTTYSLSLPNLNGRRVYGYMTIPNGNGPFPAAIIFPAFGASAASVAEEVLVAESTGMITISLSVHNTPVNQQDPNAYEPDDPTNRDEIYYRYALTGAINVINYLQTRSDFDKRNICTMGVSQGGGLAMLLAGIDNRINILINSNPAMNEHQGHKYQQASGFPYYLNDGLLSMTGQSAYDATSRATKYYDAQYANRRFKGSSYTLIGLEDDVVPSASSLAGYNQLSGKKILLLSTTNGHGHPAEYWNGRYDFLRRHYRLNPPAQFTATTKGYNIDAGGVLQASTSNALSLNAVVQLESQNLNLPGQWTKLSGPGSVIFSNASSKSTTANFSQTGTYQLRFQAQDNRKLDSEGKIYFLSDDVTVNVTTGSTGGGSTDEGSTGGGNPDEGTSTGGGSTGSLTINCPANINLTAPAGQSSMRVNWDLPRATSTCVQGSSSDCNTNLNGYRFLGQVGSSNYFLSNTLFVWKDAEAHARQNGGTLASIENQQVNDLLQDVGEIIYIGLTDEVSEGTFKWVDGTPLQYTNFQSSVSNRATLDYMALNPWDGSWAYYDKVTAKKYVLEIPCSSSSSNNAGPTLSQLSGPSSGSNFSIGTTTISYRATDPCGNTATCSFSVTITASQTNLSIACPSNQTVQISEGDTRMSVNWQNPTVSSSCPGGASLNQISGPLKNSFLQAGDYTITYRATDDCDNNRTCSFEITVLAAPTPTPAPAPENPTPIGSSINLSCPSNQVVEVNSTEIGYAISWATPQATTTCSSNNTSCGNQTIAGYTYIGQFNGSNYYMSNDQAKWEMAVNAARTTNGHLVQIESEAENNFLKDKLIPDFYLIGLSDEANEGVFVWTDGSAATYSNFEINTGNSTYNNYAVFNGWEGTWILRNDGIYLTYILEVPCSGDTGLSITQVSGPTNGSFLPLGTNYIEYEASDACGTTTTCNFTISINQLAEESGSPEPSPTTETNTEASCFITPQAVRILDGNTIGGSIQSIIDGSGLSSNTSTAIHETGNLYEGIWLNDGTNPTIRLDLGSARTIDGLIIWNYAYHYWHVLKRRGIKKFSIATSTDGVNYEQEDNFTATVTDDSGQPEKAQFFNLAYPRNARFIRLRIASAQDDPSYVGLGEIRFTNNCGVGALTDTDMEDAKIVTSFQSTTTTNSLQQEWSISPNPSSGLFRLSAPSGNSNNTSITVYNEIGKRIYFQQNILDNEVLHLEHLPKGLYLVKIQNAASYNKLEKIIIH